ncbi:hypothetical protein [Pelomonas sp. KK5]|uniref:hypothetical protein n=1 Tax=Pelomonas sp. KK5 TaxID=1855730 RepID=UPI0018E985AC|nr:hypothetical protein [Pelomonas sp. KK5]
MALLVFDQLSAPFHRHHHDFGIDADLGRAAAALASDTHAEDEHDAQIAHPAIALRAQPASALSGARIAADALIAVAAFVVVFPVAQAATPAPDWPKHGPPRFSSFKSLPPAGRAPPLHA